MRAAYFLAPRSLKFGSTVTPGGAGTNWPLTMRPDACVRSPFRYSCEVYTPRKTPSPMFLNTPRSAGGSKDSALQEIRSEGDGRAERRLFVIGILSLGAGLCVYVVARPAGTIPLLPHITGVSTNFPSVVSVLVGALPTLSHAFAFSLMTASLIGPGQTGKLLACAGWTYTEMIFELGQHPIARAWLLEHWNGADSGVPFVGRYLRGSTFDRHDLIAAAVGGLFAGMVVWSGTLRRKL